MIRTILFDLDGTLIDHESAYRRYVNDFFERHCDAIPRWRRWTMRRRLLRPGHLDVRSFSLRAAQRLSMLGRPRSWFEDDYVARLPRFVEPQPAVTRLIDDLAARFTIAVLSNGSGRAQRAKLARAGLDGKFAHVLISGEMRARKPSPQSYATALTRVGAEPAETLMVGDSIVEDFAGAHAAGLRTCWINPDGANSALGFEPDFVIDHVARLSGILR